MGIQGIVFDLDGTLIDTKDYWNEENRKWLEIVLNRKVAEKEVDACWGVSFKNIFKSYNVPQEQIVEIIKKRDENFSNNFHKLRLFDGTESTLKKLKSKGLKIGLLSNNRKAVLDKLTYYFGIKKYFDIIIGDEISRKPDPAGLLKVMEVLHLKKNNILYVGDTETDRKTAENAGIDCLMLGKEIKNIGEIIDYICK